MFLPLPQCPFCNHANPAGAKFCNDCGSPLHLKPCKHCEAVNDQVAKHCYQCGKELPAASTAPEAAPMSPALDTIGASVTLLSDMGLERIHDALLRPARDYAVEVVTRAPHSLGRGMISLFSAAHRAADVSPLHSLGAAAGRRPLLRLALAVVLPVALLTAVGVSAYYVYRHQVQLSGSLSAAPPDPAAPTVQSPLSDRRVNVPPDAPRPGACAEAVAALGLCSLNSRGESK